MRSHQEDEEGSEGEPRGKAEFMCGDESDDASADVVCIVGCRTLQCTDGYSMDSIESSGKPGHRERDLDVRLRKVASLTEAKVAESLAGLMTSVGVRVPKAVDRKMLLSIIDAWYVARNLDKLASKFVEFAKKLADNEKKGGDGGNGKRASLRS